MGTMLTPLHLLLLAEALADHLVNHRLDKTRTDPLPSAVALAIIGDAGTIPVNIRVELLYRFQEFAGRASPRTAATSRSIFTDSSTWNAW
jgi:hypothetical protein